MKKTENQNIYIMCKKAELILNLFKYLLKNKIKKNTEKIS